MRKLTIMLICFIVLILTGCSTQTPGQTQSDAAPIQLPTSSAAAEPSADGVSSASVKEGSDPDALIQAMSEEGFWIFSLLDDVTLTRELEVNGTFYDKDDTDSVIFRKLSLYAQDENRTVTDEFTLTVPKIIVNSPNFRIQCGIVKGDIYVAAEGFELYDTTVEGDVIFESEEFLNKAILERATVTGDVLAGMG